MEREILERLEKATGSDRELDRAILRHFGYTWRGMDYWSADNKHTWKASAFPTWGPSEACRLIEFALPGWAYGFDKGPKTCIAFVDPHDFGERMFGAQYTAEAPTQALAMCIALFRALSNRREP